MGAGRALGVDEGAGQGGPACGGHGLLEAGPPQRKRKGYKTQRWGSWHPKCNDSP